MICYCRSFDNTKKRRKSVISETVVKRKISVHWQWFKRGSQQKAAAACMMAKIPSKYIREVQAAKLLASLQ